MDKQTNSLQSPVEARIIKYMQYMIKNAIDGCDN